MTKTFFSLLNFFLIMGAKGRYFECPKFRFNLELDEIVGYTADLTENSAEYYVNYHCPRIALAILDYCLRNECYPLHIIIDAYEEAEYITIDNSDELTESIESIMDYFE